MSSPIFGAIAARACSLLLAAGALSFAGCASTKIDAQWADPQFKGHSLRGAKVLVVCEAADLAVKRICQDQVAAQVAALDATPVKGPEGEGVTDKPEPLAAPYLPAARDSGANAILSTAVAPDATVVTPGPSIGFGVGGFGGGGGSYQGGGMGVSVPVGAGQVTTGYAANSTLTDVASGHLMWTAKATTPPSKDVNAQVIDLKKAVLEAARKEGFF
jgi:hypothetical protein